MNVGTLLTSLLMHNLFFPLREGVLRAEEMTASHLLTTSSELLIHNKRGYDDSESCIYVYVFFTISMKEQNDDHFPMHTFSSFHYEMDVLAAK